MTYSVTPYAIVTAIATAIALLVSLISLRQNYKGSHYLAAVLVLSALWTAGATFGHMVIGAPGKVIWAKIQYPWILSLPVFFLLFSLSFNGLHQWLTARVILPLFVIPVFTLILTLTNESHHLIWTSVTQSPQQNNLYIFGYGPWFWIGVVGYSYLMLALSTFSFIYYSFKKPPSYRYQTFSLILSVLLPWIANIIQVFGYSPVPGLQLTPLVLTASSFFWNWAIVEGLRLEIVDKTISLQSTISELTREIEKRAEIERNLKYSAELLANRLSIQSSKLSSFYDLILWNTKVSNQLELLSVVLGSKTMVLDAVHMLFFRFNQGELIFEAGSDIQSNPGIPPFSPDWLPRDGEVRTVLSTHQSPDLPPEVLFPEDYAALFKWVAIHDQPMGVLAAYWSPGYQFALDDITIFSGVANGLALFIENLRLRTSIAEMATLQERRRLALELHDSVSQSLHSLVLTSQTIMEKNMDPGRLTRTLERIEVSARQALKEMRLLLYELRLASIQEVHLLDALKTRLDAVERRAGISAEVIVDSRALWQKEWEAQLYPIAMEALNNSLKHARATRVNISLSGTSDLFRIEILDDGIGFEFEKLTGTGSGIKSIARRCDALGALLDVISTPGQGTLLCVEIPHKDLDLKSIVSVP